MILTIGIILFSLLLINILLLVFSCDCPDDQPKKSKSKLKPNTPKVWSNKTSEAVMADK